MLLQNDHMSFSPELNPVTGEHMLLQNCGDFSIDTDGKLLHKQIGI